MKCRMIQEVDELSRILRHHESPCDFSSRDDPSFAGAAYAALNIFREPERAQTHLLVVVRPRPNSKRRGSTAIPRRCVSGTAYRAHTRAIWHR